MFAVDGDAADVDEGGGGDNDEDVGDVVAAVADVADGDVIIADTVAAYGDDDDGTDDAFTSDDVYMYGYDDAVGDVCDGTGGANVSTDAVGGDDGEYDGGVNDDEYDSNVMAA